MRSLSSLFLVVEILLSYFKLYTLVCVVIKLVSNTSFIPSFLFPSVSNQINFRLVGYQWECPGGDSDAFNLLINVEDCAQYCFGKATQFVFGTSNPSAKHCDSYGRCDCRCIVNDTLDQTCTVMNGTIGYNLYRFSKYIFWNPYLPNMVYFDSLVGLSVGISLFGPWV